MRRTRPHDNADDAERLAAMLIETCFVLSADEDEARRQLLQLADALWWADSWLFDDAYPSLLAEAYRISRRLGNALRRFISPRMAHVRTNKSRDIAWRAAAALTKADRTRVWSHPQLVRLVGLVETQTNAAYRLGESASTLTDALIGDEKGPTIPPLCAYVAAFGEWWFRSISGVA